MIKLLVTENGSTREVALASPATVGRGADCQLKLQERSVSRAHFRIEKASDGWTVMDLESSRGTMLNGAKVTRSPLAIGDEISLPNTTIVVAHLEGAAARPAAPPPPPPPSAPAPEARAGSASRSSSSSSTLPKVRKPIASRGGGSGGGAWIKVAVILVVLGGGGFAAWKIFGGPTPHPPGPTPGASTNPAPHETGWEEARKALEEYEARAGAAETVTDELIAEAKTLAEKHNAAWRRKMGSNAASPFEALAGRLVLRRAESFNALFAETIARVETELAMRRYATALDILTAFRKSADPSFEGAVREFVDKIDSELAADYGTVKEEGDRLEQSERFGDAAAHYALHTPRFDKTKYATTLGDKESSLKELAAAAAARPPEPVVKKDPPKDPSPPVRPSDMNPLIPRPADPPPPADRATLSKIPGLGGLLLPVIRAGGITKRFQLGDGRLGAPATADESSVTFRVGDQDLRITWAAVKEPTMFLMGAALLSGDALLEVSAYGYAHKLTEDADKLLVRYVNGDFSRQRRADEVIARARGLASPPPGGYRYDAKNGWEDQTERDERLAKAEEGKLAEKKINIRQLLKDLDAPDQAVRDAALAALLEAGAQTTARKELARLRARAVSAYRVAVADAVTLGPRNEAAITAKRKELLDQLAAGDVKSMEPGAKELMKMFYPLQGSAETSDKVAAPRARIEEIQKQLEQAGAPTEDLGAMLREYAQDAERQACWRVMPSGDQGVMQANHGMKELIQPEEYRLVVITNLYRVAMGKRALKIDVKLCKAARGHSEDMKTLGFFDHTSRVPGKTTPQDRASKAGTSCAAENIFQGSTRGEDAFWGWFNSLGHHRNMMGDHAKIGCGTFEGYWTECF